MKVITTLNPIFSFIPRFQIVLGTTFNVVFDEGFEIANDWEYNKRNIEVTLFDTSNFTQGTDYSFTIFQDENIVYKGKIIFLKEGTDVQNYTEQSQDTKRWQ